MNLLLPDLAVIRKAGNHLQQISIHEVHFFCLGCCLVTKSCLNLLQPHGP